jgi:hypothetical protein
MLVVFFIIILYTTSDNHDLVLYWFFEQLRFFQCSDMAPQFVAMNPAMSNQTWENAGTVH